MNHENSKSNSNSLSWPEVAAIAIVGAVIVAIVWILFG